MKFKKSIVPIDIEHSLNDLSKRANESFCFVL